MSPACLSGGNGGVVKATCHLRRMLVWMLSRVTLVHPPPVLTHTSLDESVPGAAGSGGADAIE